MITNERQYKIARAETEKFRNTLRTFNPLDLIKEGIDPLIAEAQKRALESQLNDLVEALDRFDALRAGEVHTLESDTLSDIGRQLIEARVARSFTQKELAERLGMKAQQIQRYESEEYQSASLSRLIEVADALGIGTHIRFDLDLGTFPKRASLSGTAPLPKLPVQVMKKRGWLTDLQAQKGNKTLPDKDLAKLYVHQHMREGPAYALHKQTTRLGGKYDEGALLAWKARVLHKASEANPVSDGMGVADPVFIRELARLSRMEDGPLRAIHLLKEMGVTVVVERHLEKTHLDGAAMLLGNKYPVIGLTLRHDRLDNFWFVLFHELGHVIRHRGVGLAGGFFDSEDANLSNQIEHEADDFARNALIPDEVWSASFIRYSSDAEKIRVFAERHGIHPSIVAGRIRRERNYKILTHLIGRNTLRSMLDKGADIPGGYDVE
jgi:HTH-type transcriptional regulator/antitoxin HigA